MVTSSRMHPELGKEEAKQSLVFFNRNMIFRNLFDALCAVGGFVFVDYALSLGVAKEKMGFFPALVYLACLFQLLGLLVINYARDRKRFVLLFGYLEPAVFILAVLAGLLAPASLRFPLLLGLIFIAGSAVHLTRPTTDAWLAAAIPERIRGRFLGRRLQISSIVMITVTMAMGYIVKPIDRENSWGFAALLIAGGVFGLLAAHMYRRITMPRTSAESRLRWADLPQIIRHRPFTRYLTGTLIYNLPFLFGVPYYHVFHLKVLQLNEIAIGWLLVGSFVIKIAISPLLGRWVDRLGPRRMIYLISPFYAVFFFLYLVSDQHHPWLIFVAWALAGVGDATFNVASTTALYQSVQDSPVQQGFFATYNLCVFFLSSLGAAVGAFFVSKLTGFSATVGPLTLTPFNLLYGLCLVTFLGCLFGAQLFPGRAAPARAHRTPASPVEP